MKVNGAERKNTNIKPEASPRRFDWERGCIPTEGSDSGELKLHNPKVQFLLEFRTLYMINIEKSNKMQIFRKLSLKNSISGGTSHPEFRTGRTPPVSLSGGDAHA